MLNFGLYGRESILELAGEVKKKGLWNRYPRHLKMFHVKQVCPRWGSNEENVSRESASSSPRLFHVNPNCLLPNTELGEDNIEEILDIDASSNPTQIIPGSAQMFRRQRDINGAQFNGTNQFIQAA